MLAVLVIVQPIGSEQCAQIGKFIRLWAPFKAFGNNYTAQISHILRHSKVVCCAMFLFWAVWPDWAIHLTLKPLATINLPESPIFLDNFCKGVKIYQVKTFWATFIDIGQFIFWSHLFLLSSFKTTLVYKIKYCSLYLVSN